MKIRQAINDPKGVAGYRKKRIALFFSYNILSINIILFDSFIYKLTSFSIYASLAFSLVVVSFIFFVFGALKNVKNAFCNRQSLLFNSFILFTFSLMISFLFSDFSNKLEFSIFILVSQLIIIAMALTVFLGVFYSLELKMLFKILLFWSLMGLVLSFQVKINPNWIAINWIFAFTVYAFYYRPGLIRLAIEAVIVGFLAFYLMNSRGAAIFCFVIMFTSLVVRFFTARILLFFYPIVVIFLAIVPIYSGSIYSSELHLNLEQFSRKLTGKALTSSRIERWKVAYDLTRSSKMESVLGFGLSAGAIEFKEGNISDSHNLFIDALTRTGYFGYVAKIMFCLGVWYSLIKSRSMGYNKMIKVIFLYAALVPISVYGFMGFTHLPGSIPFLLFMVALSKNN